MPGYVNKAILVGKLGHDPRIRNTKNSKQIATLSVVTEDGRGEYKETTWHDVTVFGDKQVAFVEKYMAKGQLIYVEGSVQKRVVEKDGEKKTYVSVKVDPFNGGVKILSGDKKEQEESSGSVDNSPGADGIEEDTLPF